MQDVKIYLDDIKHFFIKRERENRITTKRILGITFKYTKGKFYKSYYSLLKYLQPYINESLDDILKDFEKKSNLKKVSAKEFLSDQDRIKNIVDKVDATKLKPATGELRKVQLEELEFAKQIVDDIEKNTGLKPFMDDGTLLGAVRHKGFIPWDDDLDFSLEREDFTKLENYLKTRYIYVDTSDWTRKTYDKNLQKVLKKYPNQIFCLKRPTSFKCYYGTADKCVVCDFFALDCYNEDHNANTIQQFADKMKIFVYEELHTFKEIFDYYQKEIDKNEDIVKHSDVLSSGIDNYDFYWYPCKGVRRRSDIYPLVKMKFEDTEFWAPNNSHEYLKTIYNFYKKIPINVSIAGHQISDKQIEIN